MNTMKKNIIPESELIINSDNTLAWRRYKKCADYKNANNYYSTVDENYRYYQGDQ